MSGCRTTGAATCPSTGGSTISTEIRYDYYRDDGVALEAFKADAYDFRRETDPTKWATGYDFPAAHDGRVKMELLPHGRPEPMRALIFNTRRPHFADRAVREALGYALDFEWMNRTLFHGAYRRTASYYPNSELAASGPPKPRRTGGAGAVARQSAARRSSAPPMSRPPPTAAAPPVCAATCARLRNCWRRRDGPSATGCCAMRRERRSSSRSCWFHPATRRWRWSSRGRFSESG